MKVMNKRNNGESRSHVGAWAGNTRIEGMVVLGTCTSEIGTTKRYHLVGVERSN